MVYNYVQLNDLQRAIKASYRDCIQNHAIKVCGLVRVQYSPTFFFCDAPSRGRVEVRMRCNLISGPPPTLIASTINTASGMPRLATLCHAMDLVVSDGPPVCALSRVFHIVAKALRIAAVYAPATTEIMLRATAPLHSPSSHRRTVAPSHRPFNLTTATGQSRHAAHILSRPVHHHKRQHHVLQISRQYFWCRHYCC